MKRQRGRNRGGGGGGKPQQQNANRAFDSNGPDGVKVRGNAQHVFEKYQQLARDASSSGDRVLAESYLQHAEHYFRVVRAMQPQKPAAEILGRDHFSSGFDIDFEDESGAQAAAVEAPSETVDAEGAEGETRGERWRDDRPREDRGERQRDDRGDRNRDRDDRPRGDRFEGQGQGQGRRDRWRDRDDRPRDDRPREDRARDDRPRDDRPREDRPRADRDRDREDRPARGERYERRDREDRPERDPLAVIEPQASPLVAEDRASVLRDDDGGESHAPAFLKAKPRASEPKAEAPEAAAEEKPKARRRRAPRSFEGGEGAPPSSETEEA